MTIYALDLDGTLTDFEAAETTAITVALNEALGYQPEKRLVASFRHALHSLAIRSEGIPVDANAEMFFWRQSLASALGRDDVGLDRHSILRIGEAYRETALREIRLYPEVEEALELLSAQPLLLLSNGPSQLQRDKLRTLNIHDRFQSVFISEEVGARKPNPAFFAAVEAAGFAPSEIVFFGNNPLADVHGGKLAGMSAVWVNRNALTYPEALLLPDVEAPDLLAAVMQVFDADGPT